MYYVVVLYVVAHVFRTSLLLVSSSSWTSKVLTAAPLMMVMIADKYNNRHTHTQRRTNKAQSNKALLV